ncbi:hypothetical protein ABPG72_019249 [Tetrahymena utriculariae]
MNSRILLLLVTFLLVSQASFLRSSQSDEVETNQIADSDHYSIFDYWDISYQVENIIIEEKGDFVDKIYNNTSINKLTVNVNYNETSCYIDQQSNFINKNSGYFNEEFYYQLSLEELKPLIQKRIQKPKKEQK